MSEVEHPSNNPKPYNRRQVLFFKNMLLVLIDLMVLGLFNQYWDLVFIETFTIALSTAILLQFLMQVTIKIEHHVASYFFEGKSGRHVKIMRGITAWVIILISKLVILKVISIAFGKGVAFSGPVHGLIAFLTVVIVIIITEQIAMWIYRALGDKEENTFMDVTQELLDV